jgi:hypothetical protein
MRTGSEPLSPTDRTCFVNGLPGLTAEEVDTMSSRTIQMLLRCAPELAAYPAEMNALANELGMTGVDLQCVSVATTRAIAMTDPATFETYFAANFRTLFEGTFVNVFKGVPAGLQMSITTELTRQCPQFAPDPPAGAEQSLQ